MASACLISVWSASGSIPSSFFAFVFSGTGLTDLGPSTIDVTIWIVRLPCFCVPCLCVFCPAYFPCVPLVFTMTIGGEGSGSGGDKPKDTIDFDDPLYIHPSDSAAVTIISFKLTGTENFRVWRSSMIRALKARNKLGFIDGTVLKTAYANSIVLTRQWDRCNAVE